MCCHVSPNRDESRTLIVPVSGSPLTYDLITFGELSEKDVVGSDPFVTYLELVFVDAVTGRRDEGPRCTG